MKNNFRFKTISFVFFVCILSMSVNVQSQTTWFIDPNGNDVSGNGTSGNPWKSLYKACISVKTSGNIIHVNAGTYTEPKQCKISKGVSIEGEGETSHIILTYAGSDDKDFAIQMSSYPIDQNGDQSISYLKIDGSGLTATNGIIVMCRSNVSIHHCIIIDFHYTGVYFLGAEGYSTGNNFYNNIVTNCTTRKIASGFGGGLLQLGHQSTMNIYNNTFDQTQRSEGENGNCISGGTGHLANIKIHDNTFHKPDDEGPEWNFHIEVFYVDGGIEVYNNTFNGGGQQLDSGHKAIKGVYDYSWWIHDNLFELDSQLPALPDRFSEGVDLEMDTEYAIIENNHFRNLGMGIELNLRAEDSSNGMNNITIRNNIFENMGYGDEVWAMVIILVGYESPSITFNNIYIDHNTIASPDTGGGNPTMGVFISCSGVVKDVYIRNNIIRDIAAYGYLSFSETEGTGNISNIYSQNNILYNNVNSNTPYYWDETTVSNFVSSGNINSDPLLVSTSDFHLATGSPCFSAGQNVGVLKDKDGILRSDPPSIGAYERLNTDNTEIIEDIESFIIYPNPVRDKITIVLKEKEKQVSLELIDSKGVKVYEEVFTGNTFLDMSSNSSGVYFLNVKGGGSEQKAVKIIK